MKERILIFGSGRHAAVVLDCIECQGTYEAAGLIDDARQRGCAVEGYSVLGGLSDLAEVSKTHGVSAGIIAVGANHIRKQICHAVNDSLPTFRWGVVIHPSATVSRSAKIGNGSVVIAGSIISVGSNIGEHVIINTRSAINHDNNFADFSSTGPGVATGGNVELGAGSYLGIGSSVKHGVKIGQGTVIGGHSFVNTDCDPLSVYYGVPAKLVGKRKMTDTYL